MLIKSIKISGFKNVTSVEPKQYEFYYYTMIKGENLIGKTSIGDALCWVFCGRSSTGITADYILRNDKSSSIIVEAVFEDNGGKLHTLQREAPGQNQLINLDGIPIKESELSAYIGSTEIFLATFMIGYFHRLSSKVAKELLMGVIPFPSHQNIAKKVSEDVRLYLPEDEKFDSNIFLKQKRSELKLVEDEIKRWQSKQSLTAEKIKSVKIEDLADETVLKLKIDSLETRKVNLIKASAQNNSIGFLEGKLSVLRSEILNLKNYKTISIPQQDKLCPTCRQPIPEEELRKLVEKAEEQNAIILKRLEKLKVDEKELIENIRVAGEKSNECKAIQDELSSVEEELKQQKSEYEKIILQNQTIKSEVRFMEESQNMFQISKTQLEKLSAERYKLNRAITAVSQYNSIKADMQYETVRSSLKNVSIRLQRVNQSTNELRDCFEILYNGREYSQISTSEVIRAGIEISNFISGRTGLKLPIFIDNAESITHYTKPDTQVFEAKVEKDAILTVTEGV